MVGESRSGMPAGLPAMVEQLPGGAAQVSIYSTGWIPHLGKQPTSNVTDMFAVNQDVRQRYHEFSSDMLAGRVRIVEMGPRAGGDPSAYGSRPNDDNYGFPHKPGFGARQVSGKLPPRSGRPRPAGEEEEERVRNHQGITCGAAHGQAPHRAWTYWVDRAR